MRYVIGLALLAIQLISYLDNALAQTSNPVYISPNAQTGLVSNVVFEIRDGILLTGDNSLEFDFKGAYISELSTIVISAGSWPLLVWTDFTGYGIPKAAGPHDAFVAVDKTKITLSGGRPMDPVPVYYFNIAGVRCNVAPFTHRIDPGSTLTVTASYTQNGVRSVMAEFNVATFADPIEAHLKTGPLYTWSNGLWDARATISVSEAGAYSNAFETQSKGSSSDATQLIIALSGMPKGTRLTRAGIANTTSPTVSAAISPTVVFPLSGSQVRIPIDIFAQSAEKLENIDITLIFDMDGVAARLPTGSVSAAATLGPQAPDSETPIPFDPIPGAGLGGNRYVFNPIAPVRLLNVIEWPMDSVELAVNAGGAATFETTGESQTSRVGYASVARNSGTDPYGTAVFSFKQNGVTVTEAGVPATPPTTHARVFIDYRAGANAISGRTNSGTINVNTGIAVENNGPGTANVTYTLRDLNGSVLVTGHGSIAGGSHFAKFVDQFREIASDFNLPANFQSTIQFGSLELASDQPISVLALRGTTNQRNEFLITALPTADLSQVPGSDPVFFPQFADGGGYTTSLLLMNTSARTESGTLDILDDQGAPLVVSQVGGKTDSSFRYSIPSGGAFRFQTDGSSTVVKVGWVKLTPDLYAPMPVGSGVFGYNPGNVLVSESGIPATESTLHARVYVDLSGNHDTGLAVANVGSMTADITVSALQADGATSVGSTQGLLQLARYGHNAKFADQLIAGLPAGFKGVLDISSKTPFAALTLRSLVNERNDFLMTTFPVADALRAAPSPIVFPQIADGGGYLTEFVLVSAGRASSSTLSFFGEDGAPLY